MNGIGVLQVCDSLAAGGMERVAVNLANALPPDGYRSHVCATRVEGPMADFVLPHVGRICLRRTGRLRPAAVRTLVTYIRENEIQILHAHGTSLFLSALASMIDPYPLVIWHDHFGRYATEERPVWIYRLAAKRVTAVITVNHPLATWARKRLHVPADRVSYIPNFVCVPADGEEPAVLPGQSGFRIVCVANFRPQKDHMNLLEAMRLVLRRMPDAHLILLGHGTKTACFQQIQGEIGKNGLMGNVSVLGPRNDVNAVLRGCDLGVLSSTSEGLPLALLEYGMARLPVIATRVGQCEEVLSGGRCGVLVPPRDAKQLADAIATLLASAEKRRELGRRLNARVLRAYSSEKVIQQVTEVYEMALADRERFCAGVSR
ncbi:MAG TPA: glycosyltransferase [Verrucomicrobiae bacterium]|nr:glycosyltransferase [Verrucomicrobiae bacterium]